MKSRSERGFAYSTKSFSVAATLSVSGKVSTIPPSIFECTDALDPVTWWKTIKKSNSLVAHEHCDIAIDLLTLPSSSASIERIFSNFGLIQTQLRNR